MTLIVETGAGLPDAEAFISVEDADTYHFNRGREESWVDLDEEVKEQALRMATDYMAQAYSAGWKGTRMGPDQALDWPRYGVCAHGYDVAFDVVPVPVANACAELAFKATTGELSPDLGQPTIEETVGPITVKYAEGARQSTRYKAVDGMVAPYMRSAGNSAKVVRT